MKDMLTVYDFLEVDEKATKEEIEKAYQRLILEYHTVPKLSEEEKQKREIILNKLKFAYEILVDDEKRKKYDKQLATSRAEELIKNVSTEKFENKKTNKDQNEIKEILKQEFNSNIPTNNNQPNTSYENDEEINLTFEEKKKIKKAAQKEFKKNLKKAQKAEEEYNKAYNDAYNNYLRKMGYTIKEPWTFKRIKKLIITLIVIIAIFYLIWIIPPIRNLLIGIYEKNFIVKSLVDIVVIIFNAIINTFKK